MKTKIFKLIGIAIGLIALLLTFASCGEDRWCSGFKDEPYIIMFNTTKETVMVYTESRGVEQGPFFADYLEPNMVIPIDMNSGYMSFRIQKGDHEGQMALRYSFETEYCEKCTDYHLQFKSIKPDPRIRSYDMLTWDYHVPPLHDGRTDGALLHRIRQEENQGLFFPLIFFK